MDKDAQPHPTVGKVLYIEPVRVDPLYDDFRVIYRVSLYELKYYSSVFWAKKPDALFREAMGDYLIKKEGFPRVMLDVLQGDPEIVLRSNVRLIEEIDNPKVWFGRLAMDLEFLEFKTGRTIVKHSFDRRLPLEARKVRFLPAVLSAILVDELDIAVRKLAEALAAEVGDSSHPAGTCPPAASGGLQPAALDLLERLALGLGQEEPHEDEVEGAHRRVEPERRRRVEPVRDDREGQGDGEIREPEDERGHAHGAAPDLDGEDLGHDHPDERPHGRGEEGDVEEDDEEQGRGRQERELERRPEEDERDAHAARGDEEERPAADPVGEDDGHDREEHVDQADDRRLADGRHPGEPGALEDPRRVVEDGVDARDLLEDGQDDGDEEGPAEGRPEELAEGALFEGQGVLDVADLGGRGLGRVDPGQDGPGLLLAAVLDQPARALGDAEEQDEEERPTERRPWRTSSASSTGRPRRRSS